MDISKNIIGLCKYIVCQHVTILCWYSNIFCHVALSHESCFVLYNLVVEFGFALRVSHTRLISTRKITIPQIFEIYWGR